MAKLKDNDAAVDRRTSPSSREIVERAIDSSKDHSLKTWAEKAKALPRGMRRWDADRQSRD